MKKISSHRIVERMVSFSCHQVIEDQSVRVSQLALRAEVEWVPSSKALHLTDEALVGDPEDSVGRHEEYPRPEKRARHPATLSFFYLPCRVIQGGQSRSSRMGFLELGLVTLSVKAVETSS
jgi:hypothetical protein